MCTFIEWTWIELLKTFKESYYPRFLSIFVFNITYDDIFVKLRNSESYLKWKLKEENNLLQKEKKKCMKKTPSIFNEIMMKILIFFFVCNWKSDLYWDTYKLLFLHCETKFKEFDPCFATLYVLTFVWPFCP